MSPAPVNCLPMAVAAEENSVRIEMNEIKNANDGRGGGDRDDSGDEHVYYNCKNPDPESPSPTDYAIPNKGKGTGIMHEYTKVVTLAIFKPPILVS